MAAQQKEQEGFSDKEKAFFESAPVGGYDGYIAPPSPEAQQEPQAATAEAPKEQEGFTAEEEAFFASEPTQEYAFVDDTLEAEEEARLAEARTLLDAATVLEDAPTEESNIVPLRRAEATEPGFGKLADRFFQEGEERYGTDSDTHGPDGDDGEPLPADNSEHHQDMRKAS